ncbi:MAG TPA: preprotein translocase subunit SecA [Rectinema sp.]|jgi:preprotein translocase subunit SecA|nr:preprotein translocase subunit SecA [Spirochaetaceae bacterium]HNY98408.1 preprotein translocase subunit SecA [Rectinema sp.]HOD57739.1 preprotein translocase subunit SecA [Rectinema sp.]HOE75781.1 preprotein translocase subunit SecA [Rectinema sp.]HOH04674.1 preprotein translocase subunit SecA [Rectinema sp.]
MARNTILSALLGSKEEKDIKAVLPLLHKINELESWALSLDDSDFPALTIKFKDRLAKGETLDDLLPEAFALVREAARRKLGERPFDVQIIGGIALHQGKIVEMKTGEGKTLSSVTAAYLNALAGQGVHIITVNDYLAERDSQWMGQIYKFLGLTVGCILSSMDNIARKVAYSCDITYGTNNEFGFDYLRDNMVWSLDQKVQRGHYYCIIDEIDSILIDEARTPLIISGPADDDTYKVNEVNRLASSLLEVKKNPETGEYPDEAKGELLEGDYKIDEKSKRVMFTSEGLNHIELLLQKRGLIKESLFDPENFQFVHYFTQAVRAQHLFSKDVDYVVQDNQVQIVDEFTGRILHGRRYSDGLHEAIEAKERIKIARRNRTLATITFQNYFRLYKKLAGMTGTAETEAEEFNKIYNLDVMVVPTNRPVVRKDENDLVYLNEAEKYDAIIEAIREMHTKGQPILVGTVSIEKSEKLSSLLIRNGIKHEVLNAKNHAREALIIAEAGSKGAVTIATNMAGRGTDIKLGGNPEFRARRKAGTEAPEEKYREILSREYETWTKDYEEVKSLGGLCVLGTERHEARRIDNQLRGRSGRQGDPGRSVFFISLDDDLMRLFGGDNFKQLMGRAGMKPGEPIYHPLLSKSIESAQKKVEERNFEIRKHLLEYDDVLNKQRNFIYEQRNSILADDNLIERVRDAAYEMLEDQNAILTQEFKDNPNKAIQEFSLWLFDSFGIEMTAKELTALYKSDELIPAIRNKLELDLDSKIQAAGAESLNFFIRFSYLQEIDEKWLNHLESMEALREAVYLRSYAQKNPLLEYKIEGSDIFESLIFSIRHNIASKVFRVRIKESTSTVEATSPRSASRIEATQTSHEAVSSFANESQSVRKESAIAAASAPATATVVRQGKKIGRNDPCPCGSGKKYKYCHGR